MRLTRDPTNHPLWNPSMERTGGASDEDESGRLGRFRRRFGGADNVASQDATSSQGKAQDEFGATDLDWMSVGGREAKAGAPIPLRKGGKGKK